MSPIRSMKIHIFTFLGIILVQFWLGMTINLELSLPQSKGEGVYALLYYFSHFWQVRTHMILAILVLAISINFLILSSKSQSRALKVTGIIALVAVVSAIYNGISFLLEGQFFGYSIGMAMSAVSSIVAYAVAIYFVGRIENEGSVIRL